MLNKSDRTAMGVLTSAASYNVEGLVDSKG